MITNFLVFVYIVISIVLILGFIGILCGIVDTYINVKTYMYWRKDNKLKELNEQVGEMIDAKINPGGGIE